MAEGDKKIPPFRILIADDEYLIRWSLSQALFQDGHEVIAVGNGREAVEAVRNQHFDVIITDLVMPELGGWEVLEFVRTVQPQPRVIIITAHAREETGKIAISKGAWAFVEKPYIIDKIKGILKERLPTVD